MGLSDEPTLTSPGVSLRASTPEAEGGLRPPDSQAKIWEGARRTEAGTRGFWAGGEAQAPSTAADSHLPRWAGGGVSALIGSCHWDCGQPAAQTDSLVTAAKARC